MSDKLTIIGIGPGDAGYIYPAALSVIEASDVLIGGRRNLELFAYLKKEEVVVGSRLKDIEKYILKHLGEKTMVVLASGDPGIFSISSYLKEKLKGVLMEVYPGISALQYLCAKVHTSWEDIHVTSLHGREGSDLVQLLKRYNKVGVFTGGGSSPASVCHGLARCGLEGITITVGENLSYPQERIVTGSPEEVQNMDFADLTLMLIQKPHRKDKRKGAWPYAAHGIPDDLFIRGDVPMTKEEVRAISISRLRLKEDSILYDIGAGTGSISIECGLILTSGSVYAIEKEEDALGLIRENIDKFSTDNVLVVEGEAPYCMDGLPQPDRVFIGGSGGSLEDILNWVDTLIGEVRVVVNAVTLETAYEAILGLEKRGFCGVEITCVSIARGRMAGKKHLMQALNPVYIISGETAVDVKKAGDA